MVVIPNGIDEQWFNYKPKNTTDAATKKFIKLLYVGRIISRKKLDIVCKAVKELNTQNDSYTFHLDVVGTGNYLQKIKTLISTNVTFYGLIQDFKELQNIFLRNDIFVMPAIKETFGLVYLEAMSQGLPVIYCQNEGIDGYFENGEIGYSVVPNSVEDVKDKIKLVINNYQNLSRNAINRAKEFNWQLISEKYAKIYRETKNSN